MATKTNRGGVRRRDPGTVETSSARVDAPVGKAQWMDNSDSNVDYNTVNGRPANSNTVSRPTTSNTISRPTSSTVNRPTTSNTISRPTSNTRPSGGNNNIDPNAVYVAPSVSGGNNNNIDPGAVYVAPDASGGSSARPSTSNNRSGPSTRPTTSNNTGTNTRPSQIIVKPLVDKSTTTNYLYIKVVDGGKRAEEVVARMMGDSWKQHGINAAGGYDRLYLCKDEKVESDILKLAAELLALGAKIELQKKVEITFPLI